MLEFIVLGQVPGTHLQITFSEVLIIAASLLMAYEFALIIQRLRRPRFPRPDEEFDLLALG